MLPLSTASRKQRVLVIEDEPRLRELLVDVIDDFGFEASSARSAEEARRMIDASPPQILMLDLQLPGTGGLDFLEELRRKQLSLQVIILTGFGDLQAAQKAIRLDVVDFLGKPFHMADIEQALDRARKRIGPRMPAALVSEPPPKSAPTTLADIEREQILAALQRNNGNRTRAAQELQISRRTLHYRLDEYRKQGYEV
jgi:DNA-binding NtrC family response regulator